MSPAAVVTAAGDLADEIGYDNVTIALLAQRLGVRPPSLYKHVGGLDDIRRRLAVAAVGELGGALRDAAVGRSGRDALVAVATAYRVYATAHPGRYALTQRADPDDADLGAVSERALEPVFAILRGYGLTGHDAVHGARILRSALHGFAALETGGGFGLPEKLDETYERMLDVLDRALAR